MFKKVNRSASKHKWNICYVYYLRRLTGRQVRIYRKYVVFMAKETNILASKFMQNMHGDNGQGN